MPATAAFDTADPARARALLAECLAAPRWVEAVLSGRPYVRREVALSAARAALPLRGTEIHAAMAAHPRIGERAAGRSAHEQSGVDAEAAAAFAGANAEYEARFGHVYLVCATGRSGAELLGNLRSRLANDPDTELAVAGRELGRIALLRLEHALTEETPWPP